MKDPNTSALASGLTGRDHYDELYRNQLKREAEWLSRTAGQKVRSIERLLAQADLHPHRVIEVGAGTGAVISALRERGIGAEHYATDFSEHALSLLRAHTPSIETAVADVTEQPDPFDAGPYDLVIASHVIEHLEDPERFLRGVKQVPAHWFVAEVPLENLFLGRVRARFKDRRDNAAGHVQFFDPSSFLATLRRAGWEVVLTNTYAPRLDTETFRFAYREASMPKRFQKKLTEQILPRVAQPLWARFYHAHFTVLCRGSLAAP